MKKNTGKGEFDFLNFFYGTGAAVVLIAAVFKFEGSDNADMIFVTGIAVEAMVFLVSAFQWKTIGQEYQWEHVFPELLGDSDKGDSGRSFKITVERIYKMMDNLHTVGKDLENTASLTADMNRSIQQLIGSQKNLLVASEEYRGEIEKLYEHARKINDQASKLVSIAI